LPSRSERGNQPAFALRATAWQPSLAALAKAGGPGRIRTCGNTAMEEALYLTHHATKVTLIHRRDEFRGETILRDRVKANPKINVIWDSVVEDVIGVDKPNLAVTDIRIRNVKTGKEQVLPVAGVFIAIGHDPATKLFKGKLKMDEHGYIIAKPDSTQTSVEGVFAAGDVKDKIFRQAVTAAGMGCMAALEAEKFLASG